MRNSLHFILGFCGAVDVIFIFHLLYPSWDYFIGPIVLVGFVAWLWENKENKRWLKQSPRHKRIFDYKDILRTIAGGILAQVFKTYFPELAWLNWVCGAITIAAITYIAYKLSKHQEP